MPRRARYAQQLERFTSEKGETRGGGTAPPGPKRAEKPRFFRETTSRILKMLSRERHQSIFRLECVILQTEHALADDMVSNTSIILHFNVLNMVFNLISDNFWGNIVLLCKFLYIFKNKCFPIAKFFSELSGGY